MNGYCMVQITVHNADEYAKYAKLAGPAVEKFGGEFLARAKMPYKRRTCTVKKCNYKISRF